jgi:hypothetical protein
VTFFEELPEDQVTQEMKDHLKISTDNIVSFMGITLGKLGV